MIINGLTKKIDGKTYVWSGMYERTKSQAVKMAEEYRKDGYLARVIECPHGYDIYIRDKPNVIGKYGRMTKNY